MSKITGFMLTSSHARRCALLLLLLWLTAACAGPVQRISAVPTPVVVVPEFVSAPADQAIPALVAAERAAAREADAELLALLWDADAVIIDGRATADEGDDFRWVGRAAILDRYALAVFPSPPPPLEESTLRAGRLVVTDTVATLEIAGDRWRFVHRDGRWWLAELAYSRP
jgi:hypothetical protein